MRGEPFHNGIVDQARNIFVRHRWEVYTEYRYQYHGITTYLDIYAIRNGEEIGCEVETTSRHILDNAVKAAGASINLWIIVPSRKLHRYAKRIIATSNIPGISMTKVLLPDQLERELSENERK